MVRYKGGETLVLDYRNKNFKEIRNVRGSYINIKKRSGSDIGANAKGSGPLYRLKINSYIYLNHVPTLP